MINIEQVKEAFDAEVEVTNIIERQVHGFGTDKTGGYSQLTDGSGDMCYINGRCVKGAKLEVGDIVTIRMVGNDRYVEGGTNAKYYGFYAYVDDLDEEPHQVDVEQYIGEKTEGKYNRRTWEHAKADELMKLGGVWNSIRLTNAILGTKHDSSKTMNQRERRIMSTVDNHFAKRHSEGTLTRVDIRKSASQEKASYVFYTTMPERLAEALRKA